MADRDVGSIDQGTTGSRSITFDHDGQVVEHVFETHEQYCLAPGRVEHDPVEIWENTKTVVRQALEGPMFTTGGAIEWLGEVDFVSNPAQTAELARSVDSTGGVYPVPAFTGLGAPYWDGRARGTMVGLTCETQREHVVRATVEAVAYQTRDVIEGHATDDAAPS